MVIWLIGLSASGKTTVAREVVARLRQKDRGVVLLDGDELRRVWSDDLGHTIDERYCNARRASHLCRLLDQQGLHVVTAILSIFPEWQAWNRSTFSRYFEVFLDVPRDELERRDVKGLYRAARDGTAANVVGVDIPFPAPPHPDLVLSGPDSLQAPDRIAVRILESITGTGTLA